MLGLSIIAEETQGHAWIIYYSSSDTGTAMRSDGNNQAFQWNATKKRIQNLRRRQTAVHFHLGQSFGVCRQQHLKHAFRCRPLAGQHQRQITNAGFL